MARSTIRGFVGVVFALLAAGMMVAPAAADGPSRTPNTYPSQFPFPCQAGTAIATFPINAETTKTFTDSTGAITRQLTEGRLVISILAPWSGQTVTINESGPGELLFANGVPVTLIQTGQSIVFGPTGEALDTTGRFVTDLTTGDITSGTGTSMNVCDLFK